ncbi:hypothetical protein [Chryseolinea sp. H1M3-3]|uniref:hypothetical protein n=1 Tax=Chryseolinea sp. H1M3-3 TaxID=3034144 RepID=UPI0023EE12B3|nr:hypothetical protein [Chryseolinea sp. H1M3-3]
MRLISLSTLVFIICMLSCDTASNVEPIFENYFTKYYGEDGEQEGVDLVRNNDGSFVLLGNSYSQSDPVSPFIVKTDALGNVLWQREFKTDNETAVDIELINGGSQVAVLSNVERATTNACLYVLGQDGNLIDSIFITNTKNQVAKAVSESSDNGFLITGYKDPNPERNPDLPPPDQADILLLKINNTLDLVSDLSPGGGEHLGSGTKAFEISLNDAIYYMVFGYSDKPRKGSVDYKLCFQLIASNINGVPTGLHEFSNNQINEEQVASSTLKIPQTLGDGYLMIGTSTSSGSSDLYLTRFGKPQNPDVATRTFDQKIPLGKRIEGIAGANASPDGYFIVANEVRDNNKKDIFLLRVERDGAVSWTTSFGSLEGDDTAGGVEALPDGRIALLGTIQLETQKKMAFMMTNANGRFSD